MYYINVYEKGTKKFIANMKNIQSSKTLKDAKESLLNMQKKLQSDTVLKDLTKGRFFAISENKTK